MASSGSMRTHWGLAPGVKKLEAAYDANRQLLTLFGRGSTNLIAFGFEFEPDPRWVGGLRYFFRSWVGPALATSTDFEWPQKFQVHYDPRVIKLDVVLICTADHPEGEKVRVVWDPPKSQPSPDSVAPEPKPLLPASTVRIPRSKVLNEVYHHDFEITEEAPPTGVTIRFDSRFLLLKSSGINPEGRIFWTLFPIATGPTTVVVEFTSNSAIVGNQRIYEVHIGVPNSINAILPKGDEDKNGSILSFKGGLQTAFQALRTNWPDAELFQVDCNPPPGPFPPSTSPYDIANLTAHFRDGDKGTIQIATVGWWSTWGMLIYKRRPTYGLENIPWPPGPETWDIGLEEAVKKLFEDKAAPRAFWSCSFQGAVLGPDPKEPPQPVYSFTMVEGSVWEVGARDGIVQKRHDRITIQSAPRSGDPAPECGVQ